MSGYWDEPAYKRARVALESDQLTLGHVDAIVATIDAIKDDYEVAHGMEDDLHRAVLRTIAARHTTYPPRLAKAALKTVDLDFARHCA